MRKTALVLLLAAGCGPPEPMAGESVSFDLQMLGKVPEFKFLERAGVPVDRAALEGKVWICSFVFTRCATHCVVMSTEMASLQDEFEDEPDFVIVATTVDPAYDTPDVLRRYAGRYGAKGDRWLWLTGLREDIRKFAHEGMKLAWHEDDPLLHSTRFVLVDRAGNIRGYYELRGEGRMKKMREDIRALLAEKA